MSKLLGMKREISYLLPASIKTALAVEAKYQDVRKKNQFNSGICAREFYASSYFNLESAANTNYSILFR